VQEDLFGDELDGAEQAADTLPEPPTTRRSTTWPAGLDVEHDDLGRGWVWGSGRGVVTVRFETRESPTGPVRSFPVTDPALHLWTPPEPDPDEVPDVPGSETPALPADLSAPG